jgi:hypothetical protein
MSSPIGAAAAFVLGLAALGALPAAGRALRSKAPERCALDGVAIAAARRVRVVDASAAAHEFCCVDCASAWIAASNARPRDVFVTDETTGAELRAADATFVRSSVIACPETGCAIHVFADAAAGRRNAESFRGIVLTGDERPFRESR